MEMLTNKIFGTRVTKILKLFTKSPIHSLKVTVSMVVVMWGVTEPYFFDGTINVVHYKPLLNEFEQTEATRKRRLSHMWFQQDGATSNSVQEAITCLRQKFCGRLILRNVQIVRPSHSH